MAKTLAAAVIALAAASVLTNSAFALDDTQLVTGSHQAGWTFNPDDTTTTPYELTTVEGSRGAGSVRVLPITNTDTAGTPQDSDAFTASLAMDTGTEDLRAVAFDFMIAGEATGADADAFLMRVYTRLPGTEGSYDCRFDYAPRSGSTTSFTTATFGSGDTPAAVQARHETTCPETWGGMPEGSTVTRVTLAVGDAGSGDAGVGGYLDNVVVDQGALTTAYDFEMASPEEWTPGAMS